MDKPRELAKRLAMGETLTKNDIREHEKMVVNHLREIISNCKIVIKQIRKSNMESIC